jgi:hypothetical protein
MWKTEGPMNEKASLTVHCETAYEHKTLHCRNLLFDNRISMLLMYHTKDLLCPSGNFKR